MAIGTDESNPDGSVEVEDRPDPGPWRRCWDLARSPRAAAWAFGLYLAAALPLLVLSLGRYMWFFRDDWAFITDRELRDPGSLFEPHSGHLSTVPVAVFRLLYATVGIQSYRPYQVMVVLAHLGVVLLLRVIMRRVGVGPWLATLLAGVAVLFGFGREDILWGFQVGFTGAMFFALLQLVLADHDGPIDRRDALALAAGVAAVMSASPAIPLVLAAGIALLVRRGWRAAALQTVPLGIGYLIWRTLAEAEQSSPFGRPSVGAVWDWLRNGEIATFLGLAGNHEVLAWVLLALLVGGLAVAIFVPAARVDHEGVRSAIRRIATPLALLGSAVIFMLLSVQARWIVGPSGARAGRYLYFYAVVTLPALAVAVETLARRWRPTSYLAAATVVLLVVPPNLASFDDPPFGPGYHRDRRELLLAAPRMPWARDVPPDVRPVLDPFMGEGVDMGFLLGAVSSGRLDPWAGPIPTRVRDELYVRTSIRQIVADDLPDSCTVLEGRVRLSPERGDRFLLSGDTMVWGHERGRRSDLPVRLRADLGNEVEIVRPGLELEMQPVDPDGKICQVG